MKHIVYFFLLIFSSTACTSNTLVNIKSWESVEINTLNIKIKEAYSSELKWTSKPEFYVFYLFDLSNLKNVSYEYSADSIENPKEININLVRDGFLDDSIRGDIQRIKLAKNNNGEWEVSSLHRATSCWRNEALVYSSEACP